MGGDPATFDSSEHTHTHAHFEVQYVFPSGEFSETRCLKQRKSPFPFRWRRFLAAFCGSIPTTNAPVKHFLPAKISPCFRDDMFCVPLPPAMLSHGEPSGLHEVAVTVCHQSAPNEVEVLSSNAPVQSPSSSRRPLCSSKPAKHMRPA